MPASSPRTDDKLGDALAYVSLYRKYRPQTFADVVGQDHVTTTLSHAVSEDHLHHAYLFTGPRGTGKTSTARILAKAINCEKGPRPDPCGMCVQCESITDGASVDVIEIDAASHGGVDDVRELRDRVAFTPAAARKKLYIVDECHMLSTAGWNAFLKTVEEPPGHVIFVFATTEPHKVLETILSRTQRFDFKRVAAAVLTEHVQRIGGMEDTTFEPGAVDLIVRAGDGSVRDTLSVLEQVIAFTGREVTLRGVIDVLGAVPQELLVQTADLIAGGDVPGLCALVGRLGDAGVDLRQFARDAVAHLRELFLIQVAPEAGLVETTNEHLATLQAQAGRLGRVELLRAVDLLAECQAQMRRGNTRLPLELALIKAAMPEASGDAAAMGARLDRLERLAGMDASRAPTAAGDPPVPEPAPATEQAAMAVAPPAPTAASEAAQAQPPEVGGEGDTAIDLELVQRSWDPILDEVKGRKRSLQAWLLMARPVWLKGSTLGLEFRSGYGFHADNCAREDSQVLLGEVFEQILGERLRVECRVADGDERAGPVADDNPSLEEQAAAVLESEAAAAAGDVPDAAAAHEQALETLTRDLGATVVEDEADAGS
ncbi:MAG: DNA polymerase III subunit gamma/tau [Nitriliruptorales bacterium]|nr:DNA polymerase III subunit gamma/tau [Nitriliruptorales bacterium]